jgi:hypothetical protein
MKGLKKAMVSDPGIGVRISDNGTSYREVLGVREELRIVRGVFEILSIQIPSLNLCVLKYNILLRLPLNPPLAHYNPSVPLSAYVLKL